jgi:flagellar motor switch protein FliN/FliY
MKEKPGMKDVNLPNLTGDIDLMSADEPAGPYDSDALARQAADLESVFDVPVKVSAILGRARMGVGDLLKLGPGSVLELDRKVGEAIDIYVNDRLVARGEGVTMTEILKGDK